MSAPAQSVVPGTLLGDFVLDSLLGQGGGGTVYAAHWGHRPVALKVLREDLLPDPSERRRFLEEARLLAEVNHPGVVRILGYGALPDGRPYLAMEQLEGESLAERVRRGTLAPQAALFLHGQLAQAVQALHDRGLVHRDIKPENVFLVQEGRHAVLLDFGIAKAMTAPDSTVTKQGGVRGTPAYMAPERFFGAPASPATDIYELGVVLYAMLTGQLPWAATEDPVSRLNPRRPSALGVILPGRLEEVLLTALSTRAENRPGTAMAFAASLGEAMTQPATASPRRTVDMDLPGGSTALATSLQVTRDLGPGQSGPGQPGPGQPDPGHQDPTDLGFLTTQATPSRPAVSFAGVTTRSRATGESMPLPAPPLRPHGASRRTGLLLALGALGVLAAAILATGHWIVLEPQPGVRVGNAARTPMPRAILLGPTFDRLLWGLHPADNFLIVRLRHEELRKSILWEALHRGLEEHPGLAPLRRIRERCGLDLLTSTRWISVGISGSPGSFELDAVLRGIWSRDQVEACLRGFGSAKGKSGAVQQLGQVSRFQLGAHFVYIAWPDERTFMLSTRAEADPAWFADRLAMREPLWTRDALRLAYEGMDPTDTLLLQTAEVDLTAHDFLKDLPRPQGLGLTVRARGDLRFLGAITYQDVRMAARAEDLLRGRIKTLMGQEALLKLVLTETKVSRRGCLVEATFQLSESTARVVGLALASALRDMSLTLPGRRDAGSTRLLEP